MSVCSVIDYISVVSILCGDGYDAIIQLPWPGIYTADVEKFTDWSIFSRNKSQPVFIITYPVSVLCTVVIGNGFANTLVRPEPGGLKILPYRTTSCNIVSTKILNGAIYCHHS